MGGISPQAVIEKGAQLDEGVKVGPFAYIGSEVKIGKGTVISPHAVLEGDTTLGEDNWIGPFAYIGGPPQHVNYKGEKTKVIIGNRNRIREYVTVHRGTAEGRGETRIGDDNFIMTACHIAHDCLLGSRVIMANLATLGGHVEVEDDAVFGGFAGVHQRCRVGAVVMVAAMTKVVKDVPPYSLVGGEPAKFVGLNRAGLNRVGMAEDTKKALRKAYRYLFAKGSKLEEGMEKAESELGHIPEVAHLLDFIRKSSRGVVRT